MVTFEYKATVVRVVDGDTVIMLIDLGLRIFHEVPVRLEGINAPERNAPDGTAATEHLRLLLPVGEQTRIQTYKNPTDKYGRWLARVFVYGVDINKLMVSDGHAVEYLV